MINFHSVFDVIASFHISVEIIPDEIHSEKVSIDCLVCIITNQTTS